MPTLGDKVKASELGLKGSGLLVWAECSYCGHQRFVRTHGKVKISPTFKTKHCFECSSKGSVHWRWNGGRMTTGKGYILVKLCPDDFFYSMVNNHSYVPEHRLVMAKHLGRCLHRWELVHHKNRVKDDNRIKNLQLITDTRHNQITILERRITYLEKQIKNLQSNKHSL